MSESEQKNKLGTNVLEWQVDDVLNWAKEERFSYNVTQFLGAEKIDGYVLLALTEEDIREMRRSSNSGWTFSDMKKLWLTVRNLQKRYLANLSDETVVCTNCSTADVLTNVCGLQQLSHTPLACECSYETELGAQNRSGEGDNISPTTSIDGTATHIPPEFFKTSISLGYSFLVTWITSFVMVIVHERVPDMKRYPPLPDIFLDNVPHIPWAFHMCEITGTLLFTIWACVCIFHKYRMVLLRRFFALAGTVFLLRCVTMLITSLSVPGTHLQCNQKDYAVDDTELTLIEAVGSRISRAYIIWSGLGMSIQGVRTCGDYMFSGHTVALTLLNFFITEYTPRNLYFLHTLTWLLNMFGIFFILAAHEHYSIDVFVAFYITSRLFLYYHTLANNQALMSHDSNRTRIWFPMFSYFESSVDGIIPNEYDTVGNLLDNLFCCVLSIKDSIMLTARRFWIDPAHLTAKNVQFGLPISLPSKQQNAATSTTSTCNTPSPQTSHSCLVRGAEDDIKTARNASTQSLLTRRAGTTEYADDK